MKPIYYLDAPAGAGKTYAMVQHVVKNVLAGKSYLIVMPTTQMVDDVEAAIKKANPAITVVKFHGEVVDGSVTDSVYDHFNNPVDRTHVVIITAPCFDILKYINRAQDFHFIMDEVISVFSLEDPTLPNNHHIFTDCVELSTVGPETGYSNLIVSDAAKMRALADNCSHDDVDKVFQPLARLVLSKDHQVYVLDDNYNSLIAGKSGTKKLLIFAVKRPTVMKDFASCLIMAAGFKETLLYKLWTRMGTAFIEHTALKASLRYDSHQNGSLVKFYYGYNEDWSKSLKDSKNNDLTERLIEAGIATLEGKHCLLLRNKECRKTKRLLSHEAFIPLPGKSHGQNQFQIFDNVFVLAAYNLQRPAQTFLRIMFGIDAKSAKRSIMIYEIYQAIMRSSLRNIDSHSYKIVVVPDRATAMYLSNLFPGSSCESLGLAQPLSRRPGPEPTHTTAAAKQKVSREKLKAERIGLFEEIKLATDVGLRDSCQAERDELSLKSLGNNVSLFRGTLIKQIKNIHSEKSLYVSDEGPFIAFLRGRFKLRLAKKEDNEAISPAFFQQVPGQLSVTGSANVLFANGIWLDFDKTDLRPEDFANLFPNLRFVAYNTFSHSRADRRYRIWIPTNEIMTNNQYRNIVRQIVKTAEETGVYIEKIDPMRPTLKVHGIERKWDASNKFYLPCKPGDGGPGFFKVFNNENRKTLDVDEWLENSTVDMENTEPENLIIIPDVVEGEELTPLQVHIAEAALAKFQSAPKGLGHVMYYKLHRRLLHNGIRGTHWLVTMSQAASTARSPNERWKEMERYRKQTCNYN